METIDVTALMEPAGPTMADIWKTLSRVNVANHVEKKNGLSYLSWAWGWGTLMEYYPDATYHFPDERVHEDGTVTVFCTVRIGGHDRTMWLPVMDYKNNAIPKPDARKLSDTRMRCLVKCLAMFGLGHYIYAGEDLPLGSDDKPDDKSKDIHDPLGRDDLEITPEVEGWAVDFRDAVAAEDFDSVRQYADAVKKKGEETYRAVWSRLDSRTRTAIKKALAEAA